MLVTLCHVAWPAFSPVDHHDMEIGVVDSQNIKSHPSVQGHLPPNGDEKWPVPSFGPDGIFGLCLEATCGPCKA